MPTRIDAEWAGVLEATLPRKMELEATATLRARRSLKRLQDKGRIQYGISGSEFMWPVDRDELTAVPYTAGTVTYLPYNTTTQASIQRKGYVKGVALHKYDKLMNRGTEQLVDLWRTLIQKAIDSVKKGLHEALFADGTGTSAFDGFETWCATNTNYDSTGADVADIIAQPSDTYAGLSTLPGASGGTWTSALTTKPNANIGYDWPDGTGDSTFDYWSPILCNWASTSWPSGASNTWAATCEYVLSRMNQWLTVVRGFSGPPDTCVMAPKMLNDLKSALRADRQYLVDVSEKADFGLGATVNYEGMQCFTEYGCPADTLYMYRTEDLDMLILEDKLITSEGPFFDEGNFMYKFAATCPGNLRIKSPRNFGKAKNYAAS